MASLPESLAIERAASLEVRWILPGQLEASMAEWFDRFPAVAEFQEDAYLLDPGLPGISVKIRSSRAFEVKTYRSSLGILATAALVFVCDLPEGIELGTESSMSYVEWLRLRYGPDRAEQQVVDDRAAPEQVLVSAAGERPQPDGDVGRAQHAAGPQHL